MKMHSGSINGSTSTLNELMSSSSRKPSSKGVKLTGATTPTNELTVREQQVIGLLLEAQSNRVIADTLGISEETVKRHISNIMDKSGMSTRAELMLHYMNVEPKKLAYVDALVIVRDMLSKQIDKLTTITNRPQAVA